MGDFNKSGSKYLREVPCQFEGKVDVYAVLDAFNVTCPARQHAVKKLLCAGLRGKGDEMQDLREAVDAVMRAVAMQESRDALSKSVAAGSDRKSDSVPQLRNFGSGPVR